MKHYYGKISLWLHNFRIAGLWISFIASIICLTGLILYVGLEHTATSKALVINIIKGCQLCFIFFIIFNIIFFYRNTINNSRILKWVIDIFVLISVFSWFRTYPPISNSSFLLILSGNAFLFIVLAIYSIFEISLGVSRLINKKTNPSLILAGSFIFFIIIGSLTLMLPKCTYSGIDYIDSLFVATSAVSITGLCPVDVASVFTPLGIGILSCLIQIGALGVLTFTSFFALFFSGETSIYNQLMVKDMIYSKNANSLLPTLLYVFLFTLTIEIVGAVAIYYSLPSDFSITDEGDKLLFAGFQSLSAFCNAGFTWLQDGMGNKTLMNSNQWIYIWMGTLVLLGGIGFPILVNLKNILFTYFKRLKSFFIPTAGKQHLVKHIYDVNTKIVLIVSLTITLITILLFLLFEWNNTLDNMTVWQKIVQAYFNASIPRSSGFASVNPAGFMPYTLLMVMFLMWIGGSSQSTAGGIKVNTFTAMVLNLKSIIRDRKYITVFHRTISVTSIRRANSVIALSILSLFVLLMILVLLEPQLSIKDLAFEATSALFTVGSSLGITPLLGVGSKLILCCAMFVGRVGLLSLLMGIASKKAENRRIYPYDNIIIN